MVSVGFTGLDDVPDHLLEYVVVRARYQGKWIYSRHRERSTWETPGGHREAGETIAEAAARELWEESGAVGFTLTPLGVYWMETDDGGRLFGAVFHAEVGTLGPLPESEIAEVRLFDGIPDDLTYPEAERALPLGVLDLPAGEAG